MSREYRSDGGPGYLRRVRRMKCTDVPQVVRWIVRELPVPTELASRLPGHLEHLLEQDVLNGQVIEYVHDNEVASELAAFGLSGFLSEECTAGYLCDPVPHFALVLLARALRPGTSPTFLTYDEIADAHARKGVTLFPLLWLQRRNDPNDPEARELLTLGHQIFLHAHRGFRVTCILKEAAAERAAAFIGGGFRQQCILRAGTPFTFSQQKLASDHIVFVARKSVVADGWPGSALDPLFLYRPARCAFTRAEQKVLLRAESDLTDSEIAEDLRISVNSVALRWRSIYTRVAERVPFALQPDADRLATLTRGTEKRRRVIAFVRQHPEELRPYSWSSHGLNGEKKTPQRIP